MSNKIEIISIIDPVGGHGGMDYYGYGLSSGLAKNGVRVLYFTCGETKSRSYKGVSQINVFKWLWGSKNKLSKVLMFYTGYFNSFRISKNENSSIFHFHFFDLGWLNFFVLLMASLFKQKKVVTLHDVESFHSTSLSVISRLNLRFIDSIIFHNNFSKEEFSKRYQFHKPIYIIPHGNYLPFVKSEPLIFKSEKIQILFFGQLKKVKGIHILLEAMKKVILINPNYHLTIAGRPWKTDEFEYSKCIKDYGIEDFVTTYFRYIKDSEVHKLYAESNIIVMPYKKIYQSGVLLLSLSYGRSVIVSDLQPFTEVIKDKFNGFVFKSENSDDLAKCILDLDLNMITNVTENLGSFIEHDYDWGKIGLMTLKLYNKL